VTTPVVIVALIAIPAMRYLARRKIAIAQKIGSRALRADAMEAVTCGCAMAHWRLVD
jgi:divalent metal cation (Fe/Co/Zn/Cd) transporter